MNREELISLKSLLRKYIDSGILISVGEKTQAEEIYNWVEDTIIQHGMKKCFSCGLYRDEKEFDDRYRTNKCSDCRKVLIEALSKIQVPSSNG